MCGHRSLRIGRPMPRSPSRSNLIYIPRYGDVAAGFYDRAEGIAADLRLPVRSRISTSARDRNSAPPQYSRPQVGYCPDP